MCSGTYTPYTKLLLLPEIKISIPLSEAFLMAFSYILPLFSKRQSLHIKTQCYMKLQPTFKAAPTQANIVHILLVLTPYVY